MASSPVAAEAALHQLEETLTNLKATKYTYVAAMAVLVFDIVLTFDQEVVRVWNARRSLGKYLFLVNRYVPPVLFSFDLSIVAKPVSSLVSSSNQSGVGPVIGMLMLRSGSCKHAFFPPNILGILSLGTVEFILVLRTHALCQNNFLLALLVFLCIGAVTTMIATTGYMLENLIVFTPATTLPTMVGCLPECAAPLCRRLLTAFWIPFFVCETLIFSLTAWKLLGSIGELGFNNKYRSKLVVVVFRDGFIFYIVIMAISVANLLIWILAPISMAYLATSLMRSLQVTVCSRLLLNIRGILEPKYGTKNFSLSTLRARVPPGTLANDESVMDIAQDTFALGTLSSYPGTERKL